jgi:membrane-bound lytic murein transglycosylase B
VPAGPGYGAGEATAARRLSDWQRLGVRRADGRELPAGDQTATLLRFVGPSAPSYLVTENYRVVLRWNNSQLFAVAVGELADRIAGSAPQ